jgi:starch synthase
VAAEFADKDIDGWTPDVIHSNDWMTALVPAYLELLRRRNPGIRTSSVLTIHNLAFQGVFPYSAYKDLELPNFMFNDDGVEFYRQVSFLKAGIMFADKITTVSPAYAGEIQTPAGGCGLESSLVKRKDSLTGILNGVDYSVWNPAADRLIRQKYSRDSIAGKRANKEYLQHKLGLLQNPGVPLFGVLSRMTEQKGMDILIDAVPAIMMNNVQLVVMGTDQGNYAPRLANIARQYPDQFAVLDYDENFSHQLIAGIDVLVNPARFEPCGLTQMFAMKYGAIPFARKTGGLSDTVVDANFQNAIAGHTATGFLFENYSLHDFVYGINRILNTYRNERKIWDSIRRRAMNQNFSWEKSAAAYIDLYNTQLNLIR